MFSNSSTWEASRASSLAEADERVGPGGCTNFLAGSRIPMVTMSAKSVQSYRTTSRATPKLASTRQYYLGIQVVHFWLCAYGAP